MNELSHDITAPDGAPDTELPLAESRMPYNKPVLRVFETRVTGTAKPLNGAESSVTTGPAS